MFVFLIALALVNGQLRINAKPMASMEQCEVVKAAVRPTVADEVSLDCKAFANLQSIEAIQKGQ